MSTLMILSIVLFVAALLSLFIFAIAKDATVDEQIGQVKHAAVVGTLTMTVVCLIAAIVTLLGALL